MMRLLFILALAVQLSGQKAEPPASAPITSFSATSANVGGAPDAVRIDLFRWSTDAEREQLMAAWSMTKPSGRGGGGGAGRGGRGGGRGGRNAAAEDLAPDPDAVDNGPFPARQRPVEVVAQTPEGQLAAALRQAGAIGYLWSSEVAGYPLRYATRIAQPDG